MDRILLDGIDFTENVTEGLTGLELEYGLVDKSYSYSTSSAITLNKRGYEYIKDKFFSSCTDIASEIDVAYYNCCCGEWFDLKAKWEDVEICYSDCSASITVGKESPYKKCYDYLCKTFIGEDGYSDTATLYKLYYHKDNGLLQKVLMLLMPFLTVIALALNILYNWILLLCRFLEEIIKVLRFIVSFGGLISVPDVPECPDFIKFDAFTCALANYVGGSGAFYTTIRLKEVFEYYAKQCGMSFKSSIFDNPMYANMAIPLSTNLVVQDESVNDPQPVRWIQESVPTKPIKDLLEDLGANVFNADFIFKDGCLYFEPKSVLDGLRKELISWEDLEDRLEKSPCFSFCEDAAPAYLNFNYCADSINKQGSIQKRCFEGNVEWNPENSDWKSGSKDIQSKCFSASQRFMFDSSIERDGWSQCRVALDKFRCGDLWGALFASPALGAVAVLTNGLTGLIGTLFDCELRRKCDLIVSDDITGCIPLLILENGTPKDDAKVIKRDTGRVHKGETVWDYNYPLSMIKQNEDDSFTKGDLYQFWESCDPNKAGRELYQMTNLEYTLNCEELSMIHNDGGCGWFISTPLGRANINLMNANTDNLNNSVETSKIRC